MKRWLALAVAVSLASVGCAHKRAKPTPTPSPVPAVATITVSGDVNPDSTGRPSPILVRLYELKDQGNFDQSDYFALIDKESDTLGATLVAPHEEYQMQPGEKKVLELKIPPEAHFIGVAAGYRDLPNSKWRSFTPVTGGAVFKVKLSIDVGRAAIDVQVEQ
jgi:type VI secretion system protein VasD